MFESSTDNRTNFVMFEYINRREVEAGRPAMYSFMVGRKFFDSLTDALRYADKFGWDKVTALVNDEVFQK